MSLFIFFVLPVSRISKLPFCNTENRRINLLEWSVSRTVLAHSAVLKRIYKAEKTSTICWRTQVSWKRPEIKEIGRKTFFPLPDEEKGRCQITHLGKSSWTERKSKRTRNTVVGSNLPRMDRTLVTHSKIYHRLKTRLQGSDIPEANRLRAVNLADANREEPTVGQAGWTEGSTPEQDDTDSGRISGNGWTWLTSTKRSNVEERAKLLKRFYPHKIYRKMGQLGPAG